MTEARLTILSLSFLALLAAGCESPDDRLNELAKHNKQVSVRSFDRQGVKLVVVGITGQDALQKTLPLLADLNVVRLGIGKADLSQTELEQISRLPLQELTLGMCTIDVAAAECLGRIESLERFNSSPSLFADDDLRFLHVLKHLKRLRLNGQQIHGYGLRYLEGLTELEEISLTNCPITDEGLSSLPKLPRLEVIWVGQTLVTPEGLRHLTSFTSLKKVYFPDGILSPAIQELYEQSLAARNEARHNGIEAPHDDEMPFDISGISERDLKVRDEQIIRLQDEGRLAIPGQK
ncbi:hypothetical protein M4951_00120 [Blastopirellula sp. J2-11]|uniref:hypothetical protein n=1 Tax=Blastopirellula sp. J2-11 TaxID=2943192 RepID=UPI0021C9C933|nr:hypothetical protein [Blastopirellula sp. J2-11]UUO06735.1 hypothetical protein M4951_00120 [Blastopirellula sp. J2-11]